jgi:hypothetical protein
MSSQEDARASWRHKVAASKVRRNKKNIAKSTHFIWQPARRLESRAGLPQYVIPSNGKATRFVNEWLFNFYNCHY